MTDRVARKRVLARAAGVFSTFIAGYGLLILLGLLAHESRVVGALLLTAGAAGLAGAAVSARAARGGGAVVDAPRVRAPLALGLGVVATGGVVAYNLAAGSGLELAEWAILAYGVFLAVASRFLDRPRVDQAVAWSFPLIAGPLGLYALDALLDAAQGSSPLDAFVTVGLVAPMAHVLGLLGFDAVAGGQTVHMATVRGTLSLSVGVVCAGFHPGVLFMGVLGLHAWEERTPPARFLVLMALGLAGVYVANVVRLVVLALVGYEWGAQALMTTHRHAGWLLFIAWMLLYWWAVLRKFEGHRPRRGAAA